MGKKEKVSIGFVIFISFVHFVIVATLMIGAWFINKFIIAPQVFIVFCAIRKKIETKYDILHLTTVVGCMFVTTLVCLFATYIALPIAVSFLSSIITACICAIITWFIQDVVQLKIDKLNGDKKIDELQEMIDKLSNDLAVYTNPRQELIDRCNKAKLSKRDTEIAIKYFYEHNTPKEIWIWLCESKEYDTIDWDSVYKLLTRIGKKLNIK